MKRIYKVRKFCTATTKESRIVVTGGTHSAPVTGADLNIYVSKPKG